MAETNGKPLPRILSWSVLWLGLVLAVTATWWQRGSVADIQAVRDAAASVAVQQTLLAEQLRATNARVAIMENAVSKFEERFDWIIDAIRRQETRSGYTPPPPPSP